MVRYKTSPKKSTKRKETSKDVTQLSWIKRGKQRREIIVHITGTKTPTEVAKKSGYSLNHASRILNEFKRNGIVKLLNPEDKTGRLYQLTKKGKVLRDKVEKDDHEED